MQRNTSKQEKDNHRAQRKNNSIKLTINTTENSIDLNLEKDNR